MATFSFLRIGTALACMVMVGAGLQAQKPVSSPVEDMHGLKIREIHPKPLPTPFPLDVSAGRVGTLEFRTAETMTEADRLLVGANEGEIARRAGLQGIDLEGRIGEPGGGSWGYEQAVCPVFPDHVVLEYSRDNGRGDVTLFSAVIPRGEGHVRVIPVARRGYSLWTPASSNALTLNDFNHIVKEEGHGLSPDWLRLGLCYAALSGGHVRAALQARLAMDEVYPLRTPARLVVSGKGGAEVRFADSTLNEQRRTKATDWVLTFAQNGRLLKVKHTEGPELRARPVVGTAMEVRGVPGKEPAMEVTGPGK